MSLRKNYGSGYSLYLFILSYCPETSGVEVQNKKDAAAIPHAKLLFFLGEISPKQSQDKFKKMNSISRKKLRKKKIDKKSYLYLVVISVRNLLIGLLKYMKLKMLDLNFYHGLALLCTIGVFVFSYLAQKKDGENDQKKMKKIINDQGLKLQKKQDTLNRLTSENNYQISLSNSYRK